MSIQNNRSHRTRQTIYQIYLRFVRHMRTSGTIHKCLFGYRPCYGSNVYGSYWDWTTLVIRKALQQHLRSESIFLDMGTGPVGVLAIFAKLCLGCKRVYAADYIPEIVSLAQRNAISLGLNIEFYCSDLFSNINGCFDVIAFNAPYLNIESGRHSGIFKERLSGGRGGGETIARFLHDTPEHLSGDGVLVLGVNHYHIPRSTVRGLISNSDFELHKCIESPLTLASAYLLGE